MNNKNILEILPINFRHEKKFLIKNNFDDWSQIKDLSDNEINQMVKKGFMCTESRFRKIRAISIFISELQIKPHHAYLLLHSGVGSIEALSYLTPHSLELKIGRFERIQGFNRGEKITLSILKDWINKAKVISN
tara:strand:+ start:196 stop:597 length:402 start_codon:yes stop_codon:yes gene_type:complete